MSSSEDIPERTYEKLTRDQLEIYARELRDHVETERGLREELESRNRELEDRVREITALNQVFQKHLDERLAVGRAYHDVLDGLSQISNQTAELVKKAQAVQLPKVLDIPSLDP